MQCRGPPLLSAAGSLLLITYAERILHVYSTYINEERQKELKEIEDFIARRGVTVCPPMGSPECPPVVYLPLGLLSLKNGNYRRERIQLLAS